MNTANIPQQVKDTAKKVQDGAKKVQEGAKKAIDSVAHNDQHLEGPVARAIEQQTAKLPSDIFLWAALGSMGVSAILQLAGKREQSNFVGQWAPSFLILGLYNKLVKTHGSDVHHKASTHDTESRTSIGEDFQAENNPSETVDAGIVH